ncbi:polymorphic toxin type 44 domain-containing protein [Sediminibacillus albus]|uniref:Toxin 44 n=1 Tax=Sediminibacillus albus TaxID=407036 RepID=A0A1G8X5Y2_9BACI|nr:polymorphic toxin type 44 domain-containing protein [Sediminibacillus albus]SDJ85767.1 toxin 44 [Sediminibacillus albus]
MKKILLMFSFVILVGLITGFSGNSSKVHASEMGNSIMAESANGFAYTMKKNALIMMQRKQNDIDLGTYPYYTGKYFASKVKSGGDWDYKRTFGYSNGYYFDGRYMTGEALGNMHYGFTGRASGFSEYLLRTAAGAVQIYSGTSHIGWYGSYFDDPKDQHYIEIGFNYWGSPSTLPSSVNSNTSVKSDDLNLMNMSLEKMEANIDLLMEKHFTKQERQELQKEFDKMVKNDPKRIAN